jgi:hypothetical protein
VSITRRTATQHSKWFVPIRTENQASDHGGLSRHEEALMYQPTRDAVLVQR